MVGISRQAGWRQISRLPRLCRSPLPQVHSYWAPEEWLSVTLLSLASLMCWWSTTMGLSRLIPPPLGQAGSVAMCVCVCLSVWKRPSLAKGMLLLYYEIFCNLSMVTYLYFYRRMCTVKHCSVTSWFIIQHISFNLQWVKMVCTTSTGISAISFSDVWKTPTVQILPRCHIAAATDRKHSSKWWRP